MKKITLPLFILILGLVTPIKFAQAQPFPPPPPPIDSAMIRQQQQLMQQQLRTQQQAMQQQLRTQQQAMQQQLRTQQQLMQQQLRAQQQQTRQIQMENQLQQREMHMQQRAAQQELAVQRLRVEESVMQQRTGQEDVEQRLRDETEVSRNALPPPMDELLLGAVKEAMERTNVIEQLRTEIRDLGSGTSAVLLEMQNLRHQLTDESRQLENQIQAEARRAQTERFLLRQQQLIELRNQSQMNAIARDELNNFHDQLRQQILQRLPERNQQFMQPDVPRINDSERRFLANSIETISSGS